MKPDILTESSRSIEKKSFTSETQQMWETDAPSMIQDDIMASQPTVPQRTPPEIWP